ncbi:30S ribosomal protein S6 [bacterium]|nr:30S ribosomal protein S6 [bacterium]
MRQYETTFIIDSALDPDKIEAVVTRSVEVITNSGGELFETTHWGKRRLAYEIDKRQYGYYVILSYRAAGEAVQELERTFRINQNILRYLTIYFDDKILRKIRQEETRMKKREEEQKKKQLESEQVNTV